MSTKPVVGLDEKQLSTKTLALLKRGFSQAHAREMTSADLKLMQLVDAKHYLKLAKQAPKTPAEAATKTVTISPKKPRFTKTRVALAVVAGLAILGIASPSTSNDSKTVTPAAKSEIVTPADDVLDPAVPTQEAAALEAAEAVPAPAAAPAAPPVNKPSPAPTPTPAARTGTDCDPNYTGGCVPDVSYDLDCPDIGFRVQVIGTDSHRFDGDKNGVGCESY